MLSVEKCVWLMLNSNFTRALAVHLPILLDLKHIRDLSNSLTAQEIKFWLPGDLSGRVYFTASSKICFLYSELYILWFSLLKKKLKLCLNIILFLDWKKSKYFYPQNPVWFWVLAHQSHTSVLTSTPAGRQSGCTAGDVDRNLAFTTMRPTLRTQDWKRKRRCSLQSQAKIIFAKGCLKLMRRALN